FIWARLLESLLYLKKTVRKIRPGVHCPPQKQETYTYTPVFTKSPAEAGKPSESKAEAYGITGIAAAAQSAASHAAEETLKPKEEERHSIKFIVVDRETKGPIRDICLGALLTGDDETTVREYHTDAKGEIKLVDLEPGKCEIKCDTMKQTLKNTLNFVGIAEDTTPSVTENPQFENTQWTGILEIIPYKVKSDDTLASIAEAHDLTPKRLMEFNWETIDPKEINEKLRETVGCTQMTDDGSKNYLFSDNDNPGIIYIPKRKIIEDLDTNKTHVIEVEAVDFIVVEARKGKDFSS
ncbi:MAG: LysM peptidoglycan-binding domain-containing protein, partial [bacterium]|nr:LysM peptidoglycan-binding domain-containing protein [bacterium]